MCACRYVQVAKNHFGADNDWKNFEMTSWGSDSVNWAQESVLMICKGCSQVSITLPFDYVMQDNVCYVNTDFSKMGFACSTDFEVTPVQDEFEFGGSEMLRRRSRYSPPQVAWMCKRRSAEFTEYETKIVQMARSFLHVDYIIRVAFKLCARVLLLLWMGSEDSYKSWDHETS